MSYNTYIDESARSGYILAGVNVPQSQQNAIRRVLRNLRAPDSSHVHMYREYRGRQEMISKVVAELDLKAWVISVAPETAKEPQARNLAMKCISEIQSIHLCHTYLNQISIAFVQNPPNCIKTIYPLSGRRDFFSIPCH